MRSVQAGTALVGQAGTTMGEIVDSIRRVADIMGEISAATGEQTLGIEQVNEAISQMDQTTQQNASLVEEAAAASETLQRQAAELADAVRVFKLDGEDKAPRRVGSALALAHVSSSPTSPAALAGTQVLFAQS